MKIKKIALGLTISSLIALASTGLAQTCSTTQYPYPLQNGNTADAGQVMSDLDCAPIHGLANSTSNVGIGITNPPEKLWVQNGEIWATGNGSTRIGFSTDNSYDTIPNVALSASGNDAYIGNYNGSNFVQNLVVLGSNGYVGIGTTTPTQKLWVENGEIWASGASRLAFSTDHTTDSTPNVAFGAEDNNAYIGNWNGSGYFKNFVVIGNSGNVGIGTTSPAATLHVNGSAILSQGYSTTSDARLKRDVRPLGAGLDIVMRLEPVRYKWRPVEEREVGKDLNLPLNAEQVGFLAQALEKVVPEVVKSPAPGSDQTYSIEEDKLIPYLVQAVKEQQNEIRALQQQVANLKRHGKS